MRAFAVQDPPRRLLGGQGTSWVCGDLVLKPGCGPVHHWLAEVLHEVAPVGFRLATPLRTVHGTWCWQGWSASRWVEGSEPDRTSRSGWLQILDAGRAFHQAVAHLPRPDGLGARADQWAVADRVAWGERTIVFHPELASVAQRVHAAVNDAVNDALSPAQLVHADLTGNVLVSPTLPPAVIDISPYWRPPQYAEGVVIADALCWHGAEASLLHHAGVSVAAVARALLFRIATTSQAASVDATHVDVEDEARRYERAATAIGF
ncbi:TIGR02569 family protein [Angustibacter sp. Root456]|uniref:TIGR02569 family protein n=1 Tax=Angustibacter sp. Root456 TaxID=1736539 RepID=UPI0012F82742|nr:TIGR02569 family protein [Angustibacter sp. Root456]